MGTIGREAEPPANTWPNGPFGITLPTPSFTPNETGHEATDGMAALGPRSSSRPEHSPRSVLCAGEIVVDADRPASESTLPVCGDPTVDRFYTGGHPPGVTLDQSHDPYDTGALGLSLTSFSPSSSSIPFHVRCEPTRSYQTHGEAPQINSERLPSVIAEGYTRSDLTGSPGEYYYVPTFYTPSEPFVPVDPMQMSVDSHNPFHPFVSSEFSDVFSVPLDPDTFAALAASGMLTPPHSQPLRRTLEPIHQPYPVYPSLPTSPHTVDGQYPSKLPTYSHTNYNSGSQTKPTEMIVR